MTPNHREATAVVFFAMHKLATHRAACVCYKAANRSERVRNNAPKYRGSVKPDTWSSCKSTHTLIRSHVQCKIAVINQRALMQSLEKSNRLGLLQLKDVEGPAEGRFQSIA